LKEIERLCGRTPGPRWGPRAADLDLLLYEQQTLATPALCLPHPRMAWRRFVLEPAAEIAPEMIHPTTGWTLARLLAHLNTAAPYVAIAGPIAAGKTELAQAVVAQTAARWIPEQIDTVLLAAFYADPAERAWQTELHWLRQRAAQLSRRETAWPIPSARPIRWTVSDFWFDQSAAFAGVWLPCERQAEYRAEWLAARATVQAPKLTVVLDVPATELRRRVLARGRPYEQQLTLEQLEQIREAILRQASAADLGPVLRLESDQGEGALEEVLAAMRGME
jgi:deoxyadenosine/deoxycytidine kinase